VRSRVVAPVTTTDVVLGTALTAGRLALRGGRSLARGLSPVARVVLDPPLVPHRLRLRPRLDEWGRLWQRERTTIVSTTVGSGAQVTQRTVDTVLPLVDLTPVVEAVLGRLDLDAVVTGAIDRLDLDAVVTGAIDRLDLAGVVAGAVEQVDVTALVLEQVDLGDVVTAALDQVDLTDIVLSRVDLNRVVVAALDTLDLTALVQQRVDLATIAEDVVEEIDLPEIIRASTGGIATEGVRVARLQSIQADEAVSRLADRVLLRIRRRNVETDVALESEQPSDGGDHER
jgi:hypothetical protein